MFWTQFTPIFSADHLSLDPLRWMLIPCVNGTKTYDMRSTKAGL